MPRDQKPSLGRFLKRNTLYIILGALLAVLAAALILVLILLFRTPEPVPETPSPQPSIQEPVQPPADPPEETNKPEKPEEPQVFQPPFLGRTKFLANQKLALTYDDDLLQLEENGDTFTLLSRTGQQLPRLDIQPLDGSLSDLSAEDLQWLALSVVQEYYYMPPNAADMTIANETGGEGDYQLTVELPAHRDAAAAQARVRFLQMEDRIWLFSLLIPEGTDGAAFTQAFDHLVIR